MHSGTSHTVRGLKCDSTYDFRVSARGDGHPYLSYPYGDPSDTVSATTSDNDCDPDPTATPYGSLSASPSKIVVGETTSVRASNVVPPSLPVKLSYSSPLTENASCPSGVSAEEVTPAAVTTPLTAPFTDTFRGCDPGGTATVKLLVDRDDFQLASVNVTVVTPTPTPTPDTPVQPTPTPPTVKISKVFPGTDSVVVVLEWSTTQLDSLSEVKVSWDKTSGLKCRIPGVSCPGSATFTNPSSQTVFHVQRKDGGGEAFVKDSDYTKFEVKAKGTHRNHSFNVKGSFQDDNGNDKSVTTSLPMPEPKVVKWDGKDDDKKLADVEWAVFNYTTVKLGLDDSVVTSSTYQHHRVAVEAPPGTGLQVKADDTESCYYGYTNVTTRSGWEELGDDLYLVRCFLGDGNADLTFKAGLDYGGKVYELGEYARIKNVKQSFRQKDDLLNFYVRGTRIDSNGIVSIEAMGDDGLFPDEPGRNVPPPLLKWFTYFAGAKAWDGAGADIDIDRANSASSADVLIVGYWDPGKGEVDLCGGTVACVKEGKMHIEERPRWNENEEPKDWTSDFVEWFNDAPNLSYLPAVLMHEFGHPLGLANSNDDASIMAGNSLVTPCYAAGKRGSSVFDDCSEDSSISIEESLRWLLTDNDKAALKAIYGNSP